MPRDNVVVTHLTTEAGTDIKPATIGTAINVTNGAMIDVSDLDCDRLLITVTNTHGAAHIVSVLPGVYSLASLGAVTASVAATTGSQGIKVSSSRCKQADGYLYVDFVTDHAGLISATYI